MSVPARVILLACGSFNPVTNMHLRMFELARDFLNNTGRYRTIGGIISPVGDSYGKKDLVHSKHRCAMIRLALKSSTWIRLDTWEAEQECWLETIKLLRHHFEIIDSSHNTNVIASNTPTKKRKMEINNRNISTEESDTVQNSNHLYEGPVELKLLCGADVLESFAIPGLWKLEDIEEILNRFGMVVITRSGCNPEKFIYESDILSKYKNNIQIVPDWIPNEVCATRIRTAIRRGQSVKYLIQDSVLDYIIKHNLYTRSTHASVTSPCGILSSVSCNAVGSGNVNAAIVDKTEIVLKEIA